MKNLALILGIIIIIGIIALVLLPRSAATPVPDTNTGVESPSVDTAQETPAPPEAPAEVSAGDVGMEFPTVEDDALLPDATITYTDAGFSPESLTIARGDTVRFVNNSSQQMWIGSDQHPTHTAYPVKGANDCLGSSFDQCAVSGSGTSWDFTFTETGTWGYHNHRRARDAGSITVQ